MNYDRSAHMHLAIHIYGKRADHNTQTAIDENTNDPGMSPNAEKALMKARATARLDGGRGNELLTHV